MKIRYLFGCKGPCSAIKMMKIGLERGENQVCDPKLPSTSSLLAGPSCKNKDRKIFPSILLFLAKFFSHS